MGNFIFEPLPTLIYRVDLLVELASVSVKVPQLFAAAFVESSRVSTSPMSTLKTKNVTVNGRRTSLRLEPKMWEALNEICAREALTIHELVTQLEERRASSSLTAAVRVFVMSYFWEAATEDGHVQAGHGNGD